MNYPIEGNTYPWPTGVGRTFKAVVLSASRSAEVTIAYRVAYTSLDYIDNCSDKLATNYHRARYVWSPRVERFVFDRAGSDISEAEIDAIANIQSEDEPNTGKKIGNTTFYSLSESKGFVGGGYEVFLKYNSRRLMKIAKGTDEPRKEWLRQFLKECDNTPEKKLLDATLKQ